MRSLSIGNIASKLQWSITTHFANFDHPSFLPNFEIGELDTKFDNTVNTGEY